MERIEVNTVTRQFKRTFDEYELNELGKRTRLCQRERTVTPFRLALSLIEGFASPKAPLTRCVNEGFAISPFTISWRRKGLPSLCASLQHQALEGLAAPTHSTSRLFCSRSARDSSRSNRQAPPL